MKLRNKIPLKGKFLYSALVVLFAVLAIPAIKLFTGADAAKHSTFTTWRTLT